MSRMNQSEHERLENLRRGGLQLIQNSAAPCFALDAVLLADFCRPKRAGQIIELGTGTGIIALLLAAQNPSWQIKALELMPEMADLARRNIKLNHLETQIEIIQGDMRQAAELYGKACCDVVVSNPPYYAVDAGRKNVNPLFLAARSESYCTIGELALQVAAVLRPLGQFFLIHRASRLADVMAALIKADLRPHILRPVQPYAAAPANLFLLCAQKGGKGASVLLNPLIVYDAPGVYSAEMEAIYGPAEDEGGPV